MKKLILILTILALTGCAATQKEMEHSALMYDKQIAATKAAVPTPIFQMTALPGQTIELKGVQQLSVYNPSDATNRVPAPAVQPNVGLEAFKTVTQTVASMFGAKLVYNLGLANMGRGAASDDLLKQLDNSTTVANPFGSTTTTEAAK